MYSEATSHWTGDHNLFLWNLVTWGAHWASYPVTKLGQTIQTVKLSSPVWPQYNKLTVSLALFVSCGSPPLKRFFGGETEYCSENQIWKMKLFSQHKFPCFAFTL